MNLTRKIARPVVLILFFVFVFISPLRADPLTDNEPAPAGEVPSAPESSPEVGGPEAPAVAADPLITDDPLVAAEPLIDDDDLFDEEAFFFEAAGLVYEVSPIIELRSFSEVFPGLTRNQVLRAKSETGLRFAFEKDGAPSIIPGPDSGIDLLSVVMKKNPSHVIEALIVVPYNKRELDLLDIYNALGRIKNIKDHKMKINNKDYSVFTDTTRLISAKERKPIDDPAPKEILPYSETMYLRFIDPYIGDLYLRGDITVSLYGITYSMTNFRDVSYFIFRVMRTDRFSAVIYLEPIKEGILIYSASGLYLPNFIAKRLNLTPNMNRRIAVLVKWINEGLTIQEERRQEKQHFYRLIPKAN